MSDELELLGISGSFEAEWCDVLAACPLFADFSWPEIKLLGSYMHAYRAQAGCRVFCEGHHGEHMVVVVEGRVAIFKEDSHGVQQLISETGPARTLGEMSMLDGEPRSATCIARDEVQLAMLTRGGFQRLEHERPALALKLLRKIARSLSQRLRMTSGVLVDYLGHD